RRRACGRGPWHPDIRSAHHGALRGQAHFQGNRHGVRELAGGLRPPFDHALRASPWRVCSLGGTVGAGAPLVPLPRVFLVLGLSLSTPLSPPVFLSQVWMTERSFSGSTGLVT